MESIAIPVTLLMESQRDLPGHIVCTWIVKGEFTLGEPVNVLPSHEMGRASGEHYKSQR